MASSITLTDANLSRTGIFDRINQPPPYNKLYFNLNTNLLSKKIALQKINLFYSWPNISDMNNKLKIEWPTGTNTFISFNIVIPSNYNFESIQALNSFIQTIMIQNGLYLIDTATGDFIYYLSFVENPSIYGVSLVLNLVPSSLPANTSEPANFAGFPTTSRNMRFSTDSDFGLLVGFLKDTIYGGLTSNQIIQSPYTPQLSPVNTILVRCSIMSNKLSLNNDNNIIYSFTTKGTLYGSLIDLEPKNITFYEVQTASNFMVVEFLTQDYKQLNILDPSISITFLIE